MWFGIANEIVTGFQGRLILQLKTYNRKRKMASPAAWAAAGGEDLRRARYGNTARRHSCGGCWETGSPTAMVE